MKFLEIKETAPRRGSIMPRFVVRSKQSDSFLGYIVFHAPWRKFVFAPNPETIFDAACLGEVAGFIDERMTERKEELKNRKKP
jgi:hypothetical protein